jgi:microcin C transport system permease protein
VEYKKLVLGPQDWALWPLVHWGPNETNDNVDSYPSAPSKENPFGTDNRGRDVLTRLLYGLRYSLSFAFLVWAVSTTLAIVLGGGMGYFGGMVDFVGQRLVEILSTVPQFFLLLIVVSIFGPNMAWLIILSAAFSWIPLSYYVRGEFLRNRKREYVEAAVSMGASHRRILFIHMLPNSLTPILTYTPFIIAGNIVALASLDYLGFGLAPPTPSWGELLNQAKQSFTTAWWLAFYPSLCLFSTLTLLSLIGDGVRDAFDPNLSHS